MGRVVSRRPLAHQGLQSLKGDTEASCTVCWLADPNLFVQRECVKIGTKEGRYLVDLTRVINLSVWGTSRDDKDSVFALEELPVQQERRMVMAPCSQAS